VPTPAAGLNPAAGSLGFLLRSVSSRRQPPMTGLSPPPFRDRPPMSEPRVRTRQPPSTSSSSASARRSRPTSTSSSAGRAPRLRRRGLGDQRRRRRRPVRPRLPHGRRPRAGAARRRPPQSNIAAMLTWLRAHPGPVYTSVPHPDYPGHRRLPAAGRDERPGPRRRRLLQLHRRLRRGLRRGDRRQADHPVRLRLHLSERPPGRAGPRPASSSTSAWPRPAASRSACRTTPR
jgi:hypothetical protein